MLQLPVLTLSHSHALAYTSTFPPFPLPPEHLFSFAGLASPGIFRVSGSAKRVRVLTEAFDTLLSADDALSQSSPNDVASVLKYFLRRLPVPLLTYHLYHAFVSIIDLPTADEQLLALRLLCCLLPSANRDLLQALLHLLSKIASLSDSSKMNSRNLALVFSPNILKVEEDPKKAKKKGLADERSLEERQLGLNQESVEAEMVCPSPRERREKKREGERR